MAEWFYSDKGKTTGPVTEQFIIEGLRSNKFGWVDLVFHPEERAWRTLGEVAVFRQALSLGEASMPQSSWILLRSTVNGPEQLGPFASKQILEQLGAGVVQYSDYAWRPGLAAWKRIGDLEDFDRMKIERLKSEPAPPSEQDRPESSREELIENVVQMRRPEANAGLDTDAVPEGADGIDILTIPLPSVSTGFSQNSPALVSSERPPLPPAMGLLNVPPPPAFMRPSYRNDVRRTREPISFRTLLVSVVYFGVGLSIGFFAVIAVHLAK